MSLLDEVEVEVQKILELFDGGDWPLAKQHYEDYIRPLLIEEHCEVWSRFDSKQRAYLRDADRTYLRDKKYRTD